MLTGKCTCDGSGFGGLTMDEILIFPKGLLSGGCTRVNEGGDCAAGTKCIYCTDPPERFKNMIINCPYCDVDSAGNYESNCPLYKRNIDYEKAKKEDKKGETPYKFYPSSYGWICPVCGRGNAPFTSTCPCKDRTYEVTC